MIKVLSIALTPMIMLLSVVWNPAGLASQQTRSIKDEAAIWSAIAAFGKPVVPDKIANDASCEAEEDWWNNRQVKMEDVFWKACKGPDLDAKLVYFVDQFAKAGAGEDMNWLMANPLFVVAQGRRPPEVTEAGKSADWIAGYHHLEEVICRREVERFAAEPKVLERYYNALIWSPYALFERGGCAFQPVATLTLEKPPGVEAADFWHWARNFVLLAHAVHRDDLIIAEKGKLANNCVELRGWLMKPSLVRVAANLRPDADSPRWKLDYSFIGTDAPDTLTYIPDKPFPDLGHKPRFESFLISQQPLLRPFDLPSPMRQSLLAIGQDISDFKPTTAPTLSTRPN